MKIFREGHLDHQENLKWLRQLNFYEDEIKIFEKELNLVIDQHPNLMSIIEHTEEYQDIFKKKSERIKDLQEKISESEKNLASSGEWSNEVLADKGEMRNEISDFILSMESLKKNFRRFVAKNGIAKKE